MAAPTGWTYLGCFRLPLFSGGTDYMKTFEYSSPSLAYNATTNTLFASGNDQAEYVAEITIPTPSTAASLGSLPRASFVQNFNNVMSRVPTSAISDKRLGGLLVHGSNLYGSEYSYYNQRAQISQSHFKLASTTVSASVTGLFSVGMKSQPPRIDIAGGYMTNIPASQQASYGGPALTGVAGLAIVSGASFGPAVSVFDPATLGPSTAPTSYAPTIPLVYYPEANALAPWASQSTLFNGTSEIRGVMVESDGDLVFWGSQGTGPWFYGQLNDARGDNSTCHAAPYRYQFWFYTKADVMAVKAGTKQPWQITPTIYPVTMPFSDPGCWAGGMACDNVNGKVYVATSRSDGTMPLIHVFQVASAPADTTPPVMSNLTLGTVTETSASMTWTTDEPADTRVEYGPTTSYGTIQVDTTKVFSHTANLINLNPGTVYHWRAKSWDAAGNSVTSADQVFSTPTPPDPCASVVAERDALALQVQSLQASLNGANVIISNMSQTLATRTMERDNAQANAATWQATATSLTQQLDSAAEDLAVALSRIENAKAALG